jgi:hypothetical protein
MNLHVEEVPCPCPWCSLSGQRNSLHRVSRMWFDDTPPSAETKAIMDEIVKDAIESAQRRNGDPA